MKLSDYLSATGLTQAEFADLAGVSQQTISLWLGGKLPRVDNAARAVAASRRRPAPCGGTITFEDLIPPDADGDSGSTEAPRSKPRPRRRTRTRASAAAPGSAA